MGLNKQNGNMYDFVTHMWSVLKGKCEHDCSYCFMNSFPLPEIHLDEREFKTDLGTGKTIFVCHTTDMFAKGIPDEWIYKILDYLNKYPENKYLLQSKNPARFIEFGILDYPPNVFFGTTIETNRNACVESKAPPYIERAKAMQLMSNKSYETMITIEPILDFDVDELVNLVRIANPTWVNIGADSKKNELPEPSGEKVNQLISELNKITEIRKKKNLKRLEG